MKKKNNNSKIIKNIGSIIKKGIKKDIIFNSINDVKKENIGGKIKKNILKKKINEKINKPENLKQSSINQKNNLHKVKINVELFEESKTRNESPTKLKRKIRSSIYLTKYLSKTLEFDNAKLFIDKMKNNQLIGSIKSKKEKNIYKKYKFLKKLSDKLENKNTSKIIKFTKAKLLIKENIEISSNIQKKNKNKKNKNEIKDINFLFKENYLNSSYEKLTHEINQLFENIEIKKGINIYEYSKDLLPNKKCKLNYNFINSVSKNSNFSSIFVPYVQNGKNETKILPTNKLILYKNSVQLFFNNFRTKYIETHNSDMNNNTLMENIDKNVKVDLKWLKEYKNDANDILKFEKEGNFMLEKDNNKSLILNQPIMQRPRGESMNINKNNIKLFINKISNKNLQLQNIIKSDKSLLFPKKLQLPKSSKILRLLNYNKSSKILGLQNYNFSILTKRNFFSQKIEKVNNTSSINANNENTKNINENLDSQKLRARFMSDKKAIEYLKYNPYISIRTIMGDDSTKYMKDKGNEDPYQFLKTLINEGESNKFREYFSFVSKKLDLNRQDEEGNTLLILCAKNGLTKLSSLLLENGADVNIQNDKGNTALHYAISLKHFPLADLLAKHNAKEDIINIFGNTAWECIGKSVEEKFLS